MSRTALLLGASGLVGSHCLSLLLNDDLYSRVHVFVRRKLSPEHGKLEQHEVNFDEMEKHFTGLSIQDVFCCLGTTIKKAGSEAAFRKVDYEYPLQAANLALQCGAEQYLLVSALGASQDSKIFYNRVKGEIERDISSLSYKSIKIFRPSLLLGERSEHRLGEEAGKILSHLMSPFMRGPLNKYQPIEAHTVARAMVSSAKENTPGIRILESDEIEDMVHREIRR